MDPKPDSGFTFRKELYTEMVQDGKVVAVYKQDGQLKFFKSSELTASGLDKITGADKAHK